MQAACKNSCKDESINNSIPRRTFQANFKHKKKDSDTEENGNKISKTQYFIIDSKERDDLEQQINGEIDAWKLDTSDSEIQEDNDWTRTALKEKRNLGTPFVIDTKMDVFTKINLPQIFEPEQMTLDKEMICNDTFEINSLINTDGVFMTDVNSINSMFNNIEIKHLELASPVPSSVTKNDEDVSDNRLNTISANVYNIKSPIKNPVRKKFTKNNSHQFTNHNSDTKARRHKSLHQHMNQRVPKIYCLRNIVIVIMENESRLCFTGKLLVKVLYGAVKIYGFILNKSTDTTEVYSPRGYSNIAIETSQEFLEGSVEDVWTVLAVNGITRDSESKLQIDVDNVQPGTAIFMLQNFENNLTLFLDTHFSYFKLFPKVTNPHYFSWTDPRRAEIILQAKLCLEQYNFKYKRLIISPYITDIAEKMLNHWRENEWSCTLIAGGKSVGKSTSIRCLINSLLATSKKVVLIDVDPGQAECTPPGCIS